MESNADLGIKEKSKMASQTGLKEVVSLYQTLIKEWNRKPVDLEKVGKLLSGMKVSYILWVSPYFPAKEHDTWLEIHVISKPCSIFPDEMSF